MFNFILGYLLLNIFAIACDKYTDKKYPNQFISFSTNLGLGNLRLEIDRKFALDYKNQFSLWIGMPDERHETFFLMYIPVFFAKGSIKFDLYWRKK